jgi:hypothetical protein
MSPLYCWPRMKAATEINETNICLSTRTQPHEHEHGTSATYSIIDCKPVATRALAGTVSESIADKPNKPKYASEHSF